jgi:FRG domain-containing protein
MRSIEEIPIRSLGQLLDHVTPKQKDPASGRLRDNAVYRGLENTGWDLLTSLDRLGGPTSPHAKAHLEPHVLRNFVRYSRACFPQHPHVEWEHLVIAQHHGAPTRLLDWTYSPLVAAHFATFKGEKGVDRVIWKLDWFAVHEHFQLPRRAILNLEDEVLRPFRLKTIWDLCNPEVDHPAFVCLLEPPSLDPRVVAQSAAFTLASSTTKSLNRVLSDCGLASAIKKFVIPADAVDVVRDQLDLCRIDERCLFPDLDGVAKILTRYYG